MERINMRNDFDAIIDIEGVRVRPANSYEQKFGYIADIFYVHKKNGETPFATTDMNTAWEKASETDAIGELQSFGMELDNLYFVFDYGKGCWTLDCVMNPNVMRYNVTFDEYFVERATAAEAKEAARKYNGAVYTKNGRLVYIAKMPDAAF